ncbi:MULTISPECIES: type II toxin-antitoxin system VapB family antitoxin [Rhizobium]|uniref:Antitoxin VapB n=1 Tax=Rhizobium paranaense TaxID=1650438 RepID=A0A7W8XMN9_9HYPH|nr:MULTISPECIES: type II toxin-antitoxin system VapB family antitoxin [Rhizobium]MBB5572243.1 antitoxin VapB [Rhizobium paranaense]
MVLSIRNEEADTLARELARIDQTTVTDAVIVALREAINMRLRREAPSETARKILTKRGLSFAPNRKPAPPEAYHQLDHNLNGNTPLLTFNQFLLETDTDTIPRA